MPNVTPSYLASIAAAALLAFAMAAAPAAAQTDPQQQQSPETPQIEPQQVQLKPADVERFLASWSDLDALRTELDKKFGAAPAAAADEEEGDPLFALGAYLEKPEAKAQIEKTLAKHGYASFADWANVAQSVMLAFGAADPEAGPMDIEAEKKRVIDEINGDKSLSADDKKQALEALDEQFAALADFQPLPGNVEVVKPHLDRIRQIFDAQPQ